VSDALSVDLKRMSEKFESRGVFEVNQVIGIWEVNISECPVNPLRIKVIKYSDGMFLGVASHLIKPEGHAKPFRNLNLKSTPQEAIEDSLEGFLAYYDADKLSTTTFIRDDEF
jgi:hypothetical protein